MNPMAQPSSPFDNIDQMIRAGEFPSAQSLLREVAKDLTRAHLPQFAHLTWRAGIPELGVQQLHPYVRPSARSPQVPTEEEQLQYAGCLIRMGMLEEAEQLLGKVRVEKFPLALLYQTFIAMARWEYDKAIPLLTTYLNIITSPYDRLVAKVNLCSALIFKGKHLQATSLLREITHTASVQHYDLLLANALELSAANFIYGGQPESAVPFLEKASERLKNKNTIDSFYIEKWEKIVQFYISDDLRTLEKFKQSLRERGFFEFERDCDRFIASKTKREELLLHLYFGTPYPALRATIQSAFPNGLIPPESYLWNIPTTRASRQKPQELSFLTSGELKPGQLLHRLAMELSSDFYKPHRLGSLFAKLFPGEHFHPESSPHRVQEAIRRLREWFNKNSLPLEITETGGMYHLVASKPCRLVIPNKNRNHSKIGITLEKIASHFRENRFTLPAAAHQLNLSETSLRRILKEAEERGEILRYGLGKGRQYSLALRLEKS